jgi:hypothetical protein
MTNCSKKVSMKWTSHLAQRWTKIPGAQQYLSDDSRTDILWHNIPTIFHMFLTIYYDLYNPLS